MQGMTSSPLAAVRLLNLLRIEASMNVGSVTGLEAGAPGVEIADVGWDGWKTTFCPNLEFSWGGVVELLKTHLPYYLYNTR